MLSVYASAIFIIYAWYFYLGFLRKWNFYKHMMSGPSDILPPLSPNNFEPCRPNSLVWNRETVVLKDSPSVRRWLHYCLSGEGLRWTCFAIWLGKSLPLAPSQAFYQHSIGAELIENSPFQQAWITKRVMRKIFLRLTMADFISMDNFIFWKFWTSEKSHTGLFFLFFFPKRLQGT